MPTGVEADSDDDDDRGGSELCAISLLTNCMINIAIYTLKSQLVNKLLSSKMASTLINARTSSTATLTAF